MAMSPLSARSAAVTMSSDRLSGTAGSFSGSPAPAPPLSTVMPSPAGTGIRSLSGEGRLPRPILQETGHPGSSVLRREQSGERQSFVLKASVQVGIEGQVDGLLSSGNRDRRAARIARGHRLGSLVDLIVGDKLVGQADRGCFLR